MNKGIKLEEILRKYFLLRGFFVVRGVPFRFADEELTDIDLWLYSRSLGNIRSVQICDIKNKNKSKPIERIFWAKGISTVLDVDGVIVATKGKRTGLQEIAKKFELQLLDGKNISHIQNIVEKKELHRINDEELIEILKIVDSKGSQKLLQDARRRLISILPFNFGVSSMVTSLEIFNKVSNFLVNCHPNSEESIASARISFLAASIVCISLDYISNEREFASKSEYREFVLNSIRLGESSTGNGQQRFRLGFKFIEEYAPNGRALASQIENKVLNQLSAIPAEIIADQTDKYFNTDELFKIALELEKVTYSKNLPKYDDLNIETRSMLGALLDFSGIKRENFLDIWSSKNLNEKNLFGITKRIT